MAFFSRLLQGLSIRRKLRKFAIASNIDVPAIDVAAVADTLGSAGQQSGVGAPDERSQVGKITGRFTENAPAGTPANP